MPAREPTLEPRRRNRALLARQLLLERRHGRPSHLLHRLVGMQAQNPRSPYVGTWSRLAGFDPADLAALVQDRRAVRIVLMRSTVHLVTADDALVLRPLTQSVVARELTTPARRRELAGLDLDELAAVARSLLEQQPMTPARLGAALADRFPDRPAATLAHAARSVLALVQVPPRGLWERSGATTLTTVESWLGRPLDAGATWDDVALRYLAAYGPATAADLVAWSRVTGLAEVLDRLRPRLRVLRDPDGRVLFDLPRAPRPPASAPAPVRFLPDYDNLLLAHAVRTHVIDDERRAALQTPNGSPPGTVLVDGTVAAWWRVERDRDRARLVVHGFGERPPAADAIGDEGAGLLTLLAPDAAHHEVRLVAG